MGGVRLSTIFYDDVLSFPAWTDHKSFRVHLVSECASVWVKLGSIRTHVSNLQPENDLIR